MGEDLISMVREAAPHVVRADPATELWLDRLEARHDQLHDLVAGLLNEDPRQAAEMAEALWAFWWLRGHMAEGRDLLERANAAAPARPELLKGLGTIAFRQGDLEAAEAAFTQRLGLVGEDRPALADAYADLARIALRRGDFALVRERAEKGYEAAAGLDERTIRMPLHLRAAAARMEGRLDEARQLYLQSIELNERIGNEINIAGEHHNLVHVALHSGDRQEAEVRFRLSAEWIFANQNAYLTPYSLLDAGILALHDGDLDRACRLVASAQQIFETTGSIPDPDDRVELDRAVERLRAELGDRFDGLWWAGRALPLDEAKELALGGAPQR